MLNSNINSNVNSNNNIIYNIYRKRKLVKKKIEEDKNRTNMNPILLSSPNLPYSYEFDISL